MKVILGLEDAVIRRAGSTFSMCLIKILSQNHEPTCFFMYETLHAQKSLQLTTIVLLRPLANIYHTAYIWDQDGYHLFVVAHYIK